MGPKNYYICSSVEPTLPFFLMETLQLNTTQNVSLEFPVASVADRIIAFFLDLVIMGIYVLAVVLTFTAWLNMEVDILLFLFLAPLVFYHFLFEVLFHGQSPGKRMMNIRVFKADGTHLTSGSCFIRWIFRLADVTFTSGALATIFIIVNGKGQRLGDIAADTTILKISRKSTFHQTLWAEVEENYEPHYPEAETLSDQDVQLIQEVIQTTSNHNRPDTYIQLISNTREAIERKTNTTAKQSDIEYLRIMVKDYNACHRG
jgi:uncharacterized RDD family membrane protein YckC